MRFLDTVFSNDGYLWCEVVVVNQHLPRTELNRSLRGYSDVEIVDCPRGFTKPKAFNFALKKCSGRYLSFWNQESLPEPECLLLLAEFMDKNPEVGLAIPKLRDSRGTIQPVARSLPGLFSILYPGGLPGTISPGWSDYASGEAAWLIGSGLTANRYLLEETGDLAEDLPTLWSLDLSLRAARAGWHCWYRHDAQAAVDLRQWLGETDNPVLRLWERLKVAVTRLRFIY